LQIFRIRRQLVEREVLFQLISDNAADMIAIVDMEGRRMYNSLSYQKTLGNSTDDLQNSSAFEQIHPEDRERVKKAAEEARLTGIGKTLEYRFRHKNGDWLVLESAASVIRNSNAQPGKLLIVNRNITERKTSRGSFVTFGGKLQVPRGRRALRDLPSDDERTAATGKLRPSADARL
jgi:PAS domain S-box-containing protein